MNAPPQPLTPQTTLQQVLAAYPGAQRALFRRYHIGGCSSCAFEPGETLEQLCRRNNNLDVAEVIAHLQSSQEQDEQMQISPRDLATLLDQNPAARLLDVRTREEWEAVRINRSVLMSRESMQEILAHWPREELMVICDHRGRQSLDAAAFFLGQGFKNVRCLRGGIDAWSQQVDPSLPRYVLEGPS